MEMPGTGGAGALSLGSISWGSRSAASERFSGSGRPAGVGGRLA